MSLLPLNLNVPGMVHLKCKTQSRTCGPQGKAKPKIKAHMNDEERGRNCYQVLSLASQNVGSAEIKKAYRSLALRYHPDACPPSAKHEATTRFLEIQKAYETLSDPISRELHDSELLGIRRRRKVSEFPRQVWETQLCELQRRSRARMETKDV